MASYLNSRLLKEIDGPVMFLRPEEGKVKPDKTFIDLTFGVMTTLHSNFKSQISILTSVYDIRKFIITSRNGHTWTLFSAT